MIIAALILSTIAITLSVIAIHRYNTYHQGLNEVLRRLDLVSVFNAKVETAITNLETREENNIELATNSANAVERMKNDLATVQESVNKLVLGRHGR